MATVATTSATQVVPPPEFARRKVDTAGEDFQHEGSVFVTTANKKGCYIIHPDWVSEVTQGGTRASARRIKPCKCLDNTGVQRGHYVIAPDWVSEGRRFPRFDQGRSHKPWPFEFKGARHWPDQSLDRRPPTVRASWGGAESGSRPATGIHLVEHQSGWMPLTSRQAITPAKGDGMPSYSYNRAYTTSYGEQYSRTALGAFQGPAETNRSAMPWRSYNSWNVYSKELARSRREAPPRPSYMLPSASSWVP